MDQELYCMQRANDITCKIVITILHMLQCLYMITAINTQHIGTVYRLK